ncbi:MAG: hypothetical protein ACJ740_12045 [Gaiellales bacterium]|nr:hypothetical protein [Gaiellales bacterium]
MGEHDDQPPPEPPASSTGPFGAAFRAARRRSAVIPQIVQRRIDAQRDRPAAEPPPDEPER